MASSSRTVLRTALVALLTVAGCARSSLSTFTRGYDARVVDGVARLRAATAPFHSLDSAVARGYPREMPDCLIHAQHGAMGYHHVNRALSDAKVEIEHP